MTQDSRREPEPTVTIGPDARYLDATPAALEIYGVTLAEFRARSIGDFSPEFRVVVRAAWEEWARGDEWPRAVTGASIRRPDGSVAFVNAVFERGAGGVVTGRLVSLDPESTSARTTRRILDDWRRVEQSIEQSPGDPSPELRAQFAALRDEYQRVFRSVDVTGGGAGAHVGPPRPRTTSGSETTVAEEQGIG